MDPQAHHLPHRALTWFFAAETIKKGLSAHDARSVFRYMTRYNATKKQRGLSANALSHKYKVDPKTIRKSFAHTSAIVTFYENDIDNVPDTEVVVKPGRLPKLTVEDLTEAFKKLSALNQLQLDKRREDAQTFILEVWKQKLCACGKATLDASLSRNTMKKLLKSRGTWRRPFRQTLARALAMFNIRNAATFAASVAVITNEAIVDRMVEDYQLVQAREADAEERKREKKAKQEEAEVKFAEYKELDIKATAEAKAIMDENTYDKKKHGLRCMTCNAMKLIRRKYKIPTAKKHWLFRTCKRCNKSWCDSCLVLDAFKKHELMCGRNPITFGDPSASLTPQN